MPSSGKTGKLIFNALRLLGVVLFVVILFRVNLSSVWNALLLTSGNLLLLGAVFQLLILVTKGIRWHLMNDGRMAGRYWLLTLGRFYESYAFGVATPSRLGDLMKIGHEQGKNNIAATGFRVVAERSIDLGAFMMVAGLALVSGNYIRVDPAVGWLVIIGSLLVLVFSFMILASSGFLNLVNRQIGKLPGRWGGIVIEGNNYSSPTIILIWLLSAVSNLSHFVSCYFIAKAVGLSAGIMWISGAVAVSGLVNILPVTIMGLGTRELVFLHVFRTLDPGIVLAFSFLVMMLAQIGGGTVSLIAGQLLLFKTRNLKNN
ncbi:MAG TPA: lysylphosphatidylglycerol synthase transmembrane domain-containing protein [Bacteroidales bacterium]|nr:lysylphosphatidylglycerol synthase transmembrane domain-containing protein [Bacteroidales bacterium]